MVDNFSIEFESGEMVRVNIFSNAMVASEDERNYLAYKLDIILALRVYKVVKNIDEKLKTLVSICDQLDCGVSCIDLNMGELENTIGYDYPDLGSTWDSMNLDIISKAEYDGFLKIGALMDLIGDIFNIYDYSSNVFELIDSLRIESGSGVNSCAIFFLNCLIYLSNDSENIAKYNYEEKSIFEEWSRFLVDENIVGNFNVDLLKSLFKAKYPSFLVSTCSYWLFKSVGNTSLALP